MIYDVAIIGFGPTGATLANLLGKLNIRVLVLEREADIYHLPRAVHFDDEVMRVFQTVGIADALSQLVRVNPGMRFVDEQGTLLLDWPRPQEITPHGWHASYRLHQPDLEKLLRDELREYPNVQVETLFDVASLTDTGDTVEITGTARKTKCEKTFHARYVVGCDGANSMVRHSIRANMTDLGFEERWLVVDVLLDRPRPDLGDHTLQFCNPERPMTYCRSPGMRRRWEIAVQPGETDDAITSDAAVWAFLSRWVTPQDGRIERRAVYTFRSQIAEIWRKDRIFLAGDAAHLTPPFMGQGMCAGIRDAANLAWKLAHCIHTGGDDALLDSYQMERQPHVRAYIETAVRLGGLVNALNKQAALELAADQKDGHSILQSITPALGASQMIVENPTIGSDMLGRPGRQCILAADGMRMDDLAGYGHLLISKAAAPPERTNFKVLSTHEFPELAAFFTDEKIGAVWLRPDRYVGAVARDLNQLLEVFPQQVRPK